MRPAFQKAHHRRFNKRLATPTQKHRIDELARELGMEKPEPRGVFWEHDAVKLIGLLEEMLRQPVLEGFRV